MSGLCWPSAAAPLDADDLLSEILLRLPPQPSSLPRASAVCRRWRSLASDAGFSRRFRRHHRRNPPLLGFFQGFCGLTFLPALEAPNCVPPGRFSLQCDTLEHCYTILGCRHGLFLLFFQERLQILVWDPVTGHQHHISLPPGFATYAEKTDINGAVLCPAGDGQHFQVVLVVADGDDKNNEQALACVYSSKTNLWGNLISTPLPYQDNGRRFPSMTVVYSYDAVLAGDALYWVLCGNFTRILEFDLEKQSLSVIGMPVDMVDPHDHASMLMRAEGGGLGFSFISKYSAQLWKRETDCDGATSWGLAKTIELDKLIPLKSREHQPLMIVGYAEENNVVLLGTMDGFFMIHLESLKFKKFFGAMNFTYYHPFESVFTAGIREDAERSILEQDAVVLPAEAHSHHDQNTSDASAAGQAGVSSIGDGAD
ncbi:unnamed protein product [Alopecurus aequalis]